MQDDGLNDLFDGNTVKCMTRAEYDALIEQKAEIDRFHENHIFMTKELVASLSRLASLGTIVDDALALVPNEMSGCVAISFERDRNMEIRPFVTIDSVISPRQRFSGETLADAFEKALKGR